MCAAHNLDDDLNDDLSLETFGTEAHMLAVFRDDFQLSGEKKPGYDAAADPVLEKALFTEPCKKCGGTGRFTRGFTFSGQCFACKGKGKLTFKTSPEDRAAARDGKARRHAEALLAWFEANPAETKWLAEASKRGFNFAIEMSKTVGRYTHLTERQMAAVRKCMAEDADRAARIAAEKKGVGAKAVDITVIVQSFEHAMAKGVKSPKLRLDTFKFKPAKPTGANPGAIYVTDLGTDEYLGKIVDGKLLKVRACTPDQEARIIAAAADPSAAATAYGQRTGTCAVCARVLTAAESVDRSVGPVCLENYGW